MKHFSALRTYTALDYLCIDIANNVGKQGDFLGDKDTFENRIQWVKQNINNLPDYYDKAEDKYQYLKAVIALADVLAGKPTGHTVALDAICSGISIMSAITGCLKGCKATGLVATGYRPDAYTAVTDAMNRILSKQGIQTNISRKTAKEAVMQAGYGSTRKPKETFGENTPELRAFEDACMEVAPEAFKLMGVLIDAWNPNALEHSWYMPDAFSVKIKVLEQKETKIYIKELDDACVTMITKENKPVKRGVSLVANSIHACDSYILRSMVRRCSYDVDSITEVLSVINSELAAPTSHTSIPDKMEELLALYGAMNIPDTRILDYITPSTVNAVPKKYLLQLKNTISMMLHYGSFDILTIHDAFRCAPSNCNAVRYWYAEILSELADSNILDCIYEQITGTQRKFRKAVPNISALIRQADYQLS